MKISRRHSGSTFILVTVAGAAALLAHGARAQSGPSGRPATTTRADGGADGGAAGAASGPSPTVTPQPRPTGPIAFELRPGGMSRVAVQSDAPLETLDGVSTDTSGQFTVDPARPAQGFSGRVQVSVASLRTGSDLRDEHLRSAMWLDAGRFANISFELVRTSLSQPLQPNVEATGTVTGRFTLHGVTREITAPVRVRYVPLSSDHAGMQTFGVNADMLRVRSEFSLSLADYGVNILPPLRLKVSNTIAVRVDLTAFRR